MGAESLEDIGQAQQERLAYIEFCAYFLGEVRRSDITDRFGVETAAATRDFLAYRKLTGEQITLEYPSKSYRPAPAFQPIFQHPMDRVLSTLAFGYGASAKGLSAPLIPCEVPLQLHTPRISILAPITRAIHMKRAVRVCYHSFSSGPTEREITPFALANNGLRWHVRAYCRSRQRFIDFVLTRIESVDESVASAPGDAELPSQDHQWNRMVELEIVAHPKHPKDKAVIAMDYGMDGGVLRKSVRAALAGYFLRQWGVDSSREGSIDAEEIRLWLRNHLTLYGVESAKFAPGFTPIEG